MTDAGAAFRLFRDLPGFLREPLSEHEALLIVRRRMETREARLLELAGRAIYGNPRSPYLPLLREAGCELGDLQASVAAEGVEATLIRLANAGVRVSSGEVKGSPYDNPLVVPHFEIRSGGTRSPGTTVKVGLPFAHDMAVDTAAGLYANGLTGYDHAYWLLSTAITLALRVAKLGRPPVAWFYPLPPTAKLRLAAGSLAGAGRLAGRELPRPRLLELQAPERMAAWLGERVRRHGPVCLTLYGSSAVRVSAAAAGAGISLEGVCFVVFGEPFTEAKRQAVIEAGARAVVHYGFTEGGLLGYSCHRPNAADDVHLFRDAHAVVQRESGAQKGAFLLSSLLPSTPKIFLNAELGDHGVLERRRCGCPLDGLGLHDHLSFIRSHEKLTGEGMTFPAAGLLRVLEQVLPERFGGTMTDYQVLEREDERGILRMWLLVSPDLGPVDEEGVKRTFLAEIGRGGGYAEIGAAIWRQAETLEVVRRRPAPTAAGKILPFQVV